LQPGYDPFFDDFNEIFSAFFKSIANYYNSLKPWHGSHKGAVFKRVIFCPLHGCLDILGEHINIKRALKGFITCWRAENSFVLSEISP
jgi:hypothetical protein